MLHQTLLRFGRCEFRPARHELRLEGHLQSLGAKVYRLLALLLKERHRAVPRQEIVATVWRPGAILSDSVIARTAMLARRAIGDSASQPEMIQTVRGYGYRFIGDVVEVAEDNVALPVNSEIPPGVLQRFGVLPCDNTTGDPALDWMHIGLMALLGQALESSRRILVVPVTTMLDVVGRGVTPELVEDRAQRAMDSLGIEHVVHATLRRQSAALWLDWRLFSLKQTPRSGSLRDLEPAALCERLANALQSDLFPNGTAAQRATSRDPFVNQAFARGIELLDQEQFHGASLLLATVCYLEPDNLMARLQHLRAVVRSGDQAAADHGQELIKRASAANDMRLLAWAHTELAQAMIIFDFPATAEACVWHQQEALRLSHGLVEEHWSISMRMLLAVAAKVRGDAEEAVRLIEDAEVAARATRNKVCLAVVLHNRAMIDMSTGDLLSAKQRLEEACLIKSGIRREKWPTGIVALAMVNASLGFFSEASAQCELALTLIDNIDKNAQAALMISAIASVFSERGDFSSLERVRARFPVAVDPLTQNVYRPMMAIEGALALSNGDFETARNKLRLALEHANGASFWPFVRMWTMVLLRLEVAAKNFAVIAELKHQMQGSIGFVADTEIGASFMRADASRLLHEQGPRDALALLGRMVEQTPFGLELACARLDAAWLCLEFGDATRAAGLLAGAGAWRREHFAGMATDARLQFELGHFSEAAAMQQHAIEESPGRTSERHFALLAHYRAGAAAGTPPPLMCLVSDSWRAGLPITRTNSAPNESGSVA